MIVEMKLLSFLEMKKAFLVQCKLMKCLHELPDIRQSKAAQQIWQENTKIWWIMFRTSTTLCAWASQQNVDRRLVQTLAARMQVRKHTFCRNLHGSKAHIKSSSESL